MEHQSKLRIKIAPKKEEVSCDTECKHFTFWSQALGVTVPLVYPVSDNERGKQTKGRVLAKRMNVIHKTKYMMMALYQCREIEINGCKRLMCAMCPHLLDEGQEKRYRHLSIIDSIQWVLCYPCNAFLSPKGMVYKDEDRGRYLYEIRRVETSLDSSPDAREELIHQRYENGEIVDEGTQTDIVPLNDQGYEVTAITPYPESKTQKEHDELRALLARCSKPNMSTEVDVICAKVETCTIKDEVANKPIVIAQIPTKKPTNITLAMRKSDPNIDPEVLTFFDLYYVKVEDDPWKHHLPASNIYNKYASWKGNEKQLPLGRSMFYAELDKHLPLGRRNYHYYGVELKEDV